MHRQDLKRHQRVASPRKYTRVTVTLHSGVATTKHLYRGLDVSKKRNYLKRRKFVGSQRRRVRARSSSWAVPSGRLVFGICDTQDESLSWQTQSRHRAASVEFYEKPRKVNLLLEPNQEQLRNYSNENTTGQRSGILGSKERRNNKNGSARQPLRPRSGSDSGSLPCSNHLQENTTEQGTFLSKETHESNDVDNTDVADTPLGVIQRESNEQATSLKKDHQAWMLTVIDLLYDFLFGTVSVSDTDVSSEVFKIHRHSIAEAKLLKAVLFDTVFGESPSTQREALGEIQPPSSGSPSEPSTVTHAQQRVAESHAPSPSSTRVVLGSTTVHRLMRNICQLNRQPRVPDIVPRNEAKCESSSLSPPRDSSWFSPEQVLLAALYKRMPKLRRYFPCVLASTCAEHSEQCSPEGAALEHGSHGRLAKPTAFEPLAGVGGGRAGLVVLICKILRDEVDESSVSVKENGALGRAPVDVPIAVTPDMFEEIRIVLQVILRMIKGNDSVDHLIVALTHLMAIHPYFVSETVLWKLIRGWPTKDSKQALCYLGIMDTILHICPLDAVQRSPLYQMVFKRLTKELQSLNTLVARRVLAILGAPHIILHWIAPNQETRVMVQEALHKNAQGHWSAPVRTESDELFDSLLDYAA